MPNTRKRDGCEIWSPNPATGNTRAKDPQVGEVVESALVRTQVAQNHPAHDARAIANVILDQSDALGIAVYSTTLLKVLYFSHGWHLARFDAPLVAQPFEAWQHGPVVRVVYDQIKSASGKPIRHRLTAFDPKVMLPRVATATLSQSTISLIRAVLRAYGALHPYTLSELTHEEGSPWGAVWEAALAGSAPGGKLDDGDIRRYFLRQNENDVLGNG